MRIYNEQDIKSVMLGATLLASGGGGSYGDGLTLLDNFKRANPNIEISIKLIENYEVSNDSYAVIIAGIGAPTGQADQDFSPCVISCFDEFQSYICPRIGKQIQCVAPVEMGGFNTLVPMLAAMKYDLPVVNTDGAGRAVPTLNTTLMNLFNIPAAPVALTDGYDNRVSIIINHETDEDMIEDISREISEAFNANAAIGGWLMNKPLCNQTAIGSISLAIGYGDMIQKIAAEHAGEENIGEYVAQELAEDEFTDVICTNGKVTEFSSEEIDGFDIGSYKVADIDAVRNEGYRIVFKNESLLLYHIGEDSNESIYMTAPDIISMIDRKTGMPLTNEDLAQIFINDQLTDLRVILIKMKVDVSWWYNEEKTSIIWKKLFSDLGYDGEIVKF